MRQGDGLIRPDRDPRSARAVAQKNGQNRLAGGPASECGAQCQISAGGRYAQALENALHGLGLIRFLRESRRSFKKRRVGGAKTGGTLGGKPSQRVGGVRRLPAVEKGDGGKTILRGPARTVAHAVQRLRVQRMNAAPFGLARVRGIDKQGLTA